MTTRLTGLRFPIFILGLMATLLASTSACNRDQEVQGVYQKHLQAVQKLKSMNSSQLAQVLRSESERGIEPFNSLTYGETTSRGAAAASALVASLKSNKPDHAGLLELLALRKVSPSEYRSLEPQFRVNVLVDALKNSKKFNAWGVPHARWEEAGTALIEEGEPAKQALIPLLQDERAAPLWGSGSVAESQRYQYRLNDYAFALTNAIDKKNTKPILEKSERDKQIHELLNESRNRSHTVAPPPGLHSP